MSGEEVPNSGQGEHRASTAANLIARYLGVSGPWPWATTVVCTTMIVLFLGLHLTPNPSSETALNRWGYLSAFQIWSGGPRYLYVLLTSSFLHQALGHIALNLAAIWIVGRVIEPILGTKRMAWLILGSALVSSAAQLAIFGNTGLGASGIAYGLFGFGLVKRKKFAEVKRLFSERFIVVWLTWFGAAWVILTRQIANGGHLGGLVFGLCAGGALLFQEAATAQECRACGIRCPRHCSGDDLSVVWSLVVCNWLQGTLPRLLRVGSRRVRNEPRGKTGSDLGFKKSRPSPMG